MFVGVRAVNQPLSTVKAPPTKTKTMTVSDSRFSYFNTSENKSSTVEFVIHTTSLLTLMLPTTSNLHSLPSCTLVPVLT